MHIYRLLSEKQLLVVVVVVGYVSCLPAWLFAYYKHTDWLTD